MAHRGAVILAALLNKIFTENRAPQAWTTSTMVPIWKGKDDVSECINYHPIRLLSHTMKIFEHVLTRHHQHQLQPMQLRQGTRNHGRYPCCPLADGKVSGKELAHLYGLPGPREGFLLCSPQINLGVPPIPLCPRGLYQHHIPGPYFIRTMYSSLTVSSKTSKTINNGGKPAWTRMPYGLTSTRRSTWKVPPPQTSDTISIDGIDLKKATQFRYFGSTLSANSNSLPDVRSRVKAAWLKWRQVTGVLCDKSMPKHPKAKIL